MKLSASNIGWHKADDDFVLRQLMYLGFSGLEFAPSKVTNQIPYSKAAINESRKYFTKVFENFGLRPSSMQSIWYGVNRNIFNSAEDNSWLIEYTIRAMDYSREVGCKNIVFGCPLNRNLQDAHNAGYAIKFFSKIEEYASSIGINFAIEANPRIYSTNFLNTHNEVFNFLINHDLYGLRINYDIGAAISNFEKSSSVTKMKNMISHVHISEPFLNPIRPRKRHMSFKKIFENNYDGYVSIEMKAIEKEYFCGVASYVRSIFSDI